MIGVDVVIGVGVSVGVVIGVGVSVGVVIGVGVSVGVAVTVGVTTGAGVVVVTAGLIGDGVTLGVTEGVTVGVTGHFRSDLCMVICIVRYAGMPREGQRLRRCGHGNAAAQGCRQQSCRQ